MHFVDQFNKEAKRCWEGYEPVPGKEPYSDDSCRPVGGKSKDKKKESKLKDPEGGLTAAGRRHYEQSGESKDLKPGVKERDPGKMSPEQLRRKGSWATRFYGQSPLPPLKKPNGEPTRLALTAKAWGEPVPQTEADARRIAAKGRVLLERYKGKKKESALEKEALVPETAGALAALRGGTRPEAEAVEAALRKQIKRYQRPVKKKLWDVVKQLEAPATRRLREARIAEGMGHGAPTELQKTLMRGGSFLIDNPEQLPLKVQPIPGLSLAAIPAKGGARRLAKRVIASAPSG